LNTYELKPVSIFQHPEIALTTLQPFQLKIGL